jgi:acetyltransferase-like isoleucine patch superfamily enzyme
MLTAKQVFHPLIAGEKVPDDWYPGLVPKNIEAGKNSMIDSSFCFKHFFSSLQTGLSVGNNVTIWRTALSTEEDGFIEIGDYSYITNASLVCCKKIIIGKRVFIAGGVTIADSDFHPLDPAARLADTIALSPIGNSIKRPHIKSKPVFIEDDVWIGFNATILKGVHIGAGAIINPGAMVIENVPSGTTVAGNPARPINIINERKLYTGGL